MIQCFFSMMFHLIDGKGNSEKGVFALICLGEG